MPLAGSLPCSLIHYHSSPLLSKTLPLFLHRHRRHVRLLSFAVPLSSSLRHNIKHLPSNPKPKPKPRPRPHIHRRPMTTSPLNPNLNPNPQNPNSSSSSARAAKKARREAPENVLRHKIGVCSRNQDLPAALRLFDAARRDAVPLNLDHYNCLLYLCSLSSQDSARGLELYDQMLLDKIKPNEATFTSLARLAANDKSPERAFHFVKQMAAATIPPKLRSYGLALFGFCDNGDFERDWEVELHMDASGVVPEEPELIALMKVSALARRGEEVYRILHRLRSLVRKVSEETAEVVEGWFESEVAAGVGKEEWDEREVKEGVVKGGGGWHGTGGLGKGKWSVGRSEMDGNGVCRRCGERLVCVDIDPVETEEFARKLANLASEREVKADFIRFQEWLKHHGPFDAVVDGANVGLNNQHNFSFFQVLVVCSSVSSKSLLVTNDEMRDHLFELLGTNFFPRWKEKHQVWLTFSKRGPNFHMPPSYSIVIQESERGSWHIPTILGDDIETPRQWVCATRDLNAVSSLSDPQIAQMTL